MMVRNENKRTFILHPANLKKRSPIERLSPDRFLKSVSALDDDESGINNLDGPYDTLRSLSIQPEPITLSLKQLSYTVQVPGKDKKEMEDRLLLNEVSAMFVPGSMTTLMGSSGAGMSTLMDDIAGRKNTGKISGELLVNGDSIDNATFARASGYVEQVISESSRLIPPTVPDSASPSFSRPASTFRPRQFTRPSVSRPTTEGDAWYRKRLGCRGGGRPDRAAPDLEQGHQACRRRISVGSSNARG
eukprot:3003449-Rhodomonas_salina.1